MHTKQATNSHDIFQQALQLHQQGQLEQAEALYEKVLQAEPQHIDALHFFGVLKNQQGQSQQAVDLIRQSLSLNPNNAAAYSNLGLALHELKRFDEAIDSYNHALAINPNSAETYNNRGNVLEKLGCIDEALLNYDHALILKPDYAEALYNQGNLFRHLKRYEDTLTNYERALAIQPNYAEALFVYATLLNDLKRVDEAIIHCEQALTIDPDIPFILGAYLTMKMNACNWQKLDSYIQQLTDGVKRGKKNTTAAAVLSISSSLWIQQQATELYTKTEYPCLISLAIPKKYEHNKIRIGYFSADFRNHPVSYLLAGLVKCHDRTRFEIIAFSFHATTQKDEMRLQMEQTFDQFMDVSQQSDAQVVQLARQMEIDIAIDLNGFTDGCRANIFAMRIAPIQVNYLGYSATMGADYMDYLLADKVLIPAEYRAYYTENIVYLPNSYMVTDSRRCISDTPMSRAEFGLPERNFVFCCFNNAYKITPSVFDVWMRLLQKVAGSVIWLSEANTTVTRNLQREATDRGIAPERLIFAKRLPLLADHLARHRLADLFLDTLPYNAHATSSGALWAGLPVLTCVGEAFASRVAASLLTAIGLPELITENLSDYESLAVQLATHPEQLAAIKQKLATNRLTHPLFDTDLFTQHIEAAYLAMYDRYQADLPPEHIYVSTAIKGVETQQSSVPVIEKPLPANKTGFFAKVSRLLSRKNETVATQKKTDIEKFEHAQRLHQQGQFAAAEVLYEELLATQPDNIEITRCLAMLKKQHSPKKHPSPIKTTPTAVAIRQIAPQTAAVINNNDDSIEELINQGNELEDSNQLEQALASYDNAISINPNSARAHSNRGNVLQSLQRFDEALASYDRAIAIKPDYAEAFYNRGNTLQACKRLAEAIASYDCALDMKPDFVQAWVSRGNALHDSKQEMQALISYDKALAIVPDYPEVLCNRGNALSELNRLNDALASYQQAFAIRPDYVEALIASAVVLQELKRSDEALLSYEQALAIQPDLTLALGYWLFIKMTLCDWHKLTQHQQRVIDGIDHGEKIATPFTTLAISSAVLIQQKAAEIYTQQNFANAEHLLPAINKHQHQKIKIAYFSADFRHHAVSYLIAELIERHDRSQFEVIAFALDLISYKDDMRLQLEAAFDQFIDVSQQSDEQIVHLARQLEIDIAVDLNGFTKGFRTDIFAMRLAPIQVNYLGYSATMGADYMDYLLADKVIIPDEYRAYYTEKIAYLPNSYMVNDSRRCISDKAISRSEFGLPEQGLVFCCFNNAYKITPNVFDVWLRLLEKIDGSVLWLSGGNATVVSNLQRTASTHGIAPERLVFAKHLPSAAEHLARYRLADLFLDTQPYNAHATSSDALWAGLPVLTCVGEAFASRVAASLLTAIGLPELITDNLTDYEALAIRLASHPDQLAAIKQKLADHRLSYPLFDTALFTRHIEAAYQAMYDRYQADLPPDHIYVSAKTDGVMEIPVTHTLPQDNADKLLLAMNLHQQGQLEQAEALYEQVLQAEAQHIDALHFLGVLKNQQGQSERAVDLIRQSLAIDADNGAAYSNLGLALYKLKRYEEAIASYDQALIINPQHGEALNNRGNALEVLKRTEEAIDSYERGLAIRADDGFFLGSCLHLKMSLCIWEKFEVNLEQLTNALNRGEKVVTPFSLLALPISVGLHKKAAKIYHQCEYTAKQLLPSIEKRTHSRIKIGYFSSDFCNHPVAYLTAQLFEFHDRSRFEIIAFSFRAMAQKDSMRLRLEGTFEQFIDVSQQSDEQIVQLTRQMEIDIAIDLNGFTDGCRTNIFVMRAAPIQVSYLGYSGTMGADYIDYILADRVLIPEEYRAYYTEKIAYLPNSYMANDNTRIISDKPMSRDEFGLPEHGFVFCCFNNSYKITPSVFTVWMRLLEKISGSVLWLSESNAHVADNLRKEAKARGIASERLIFAKRLPVLADHLARHRLADLFLDTQPYNAHTTTSDALWAGLPVLTCVGESFASRVAASLLTAIGLPELITDNLTDYEALAIQLATQPEQLAAIKQKLADNSLSYPLFDTALFTQHIEAAYQAMYARYQADLAPEHIYGVETQQLSVPVIDKTMLANKISFFAKVARLISRKKNDTVAPQTKASTEKFEHAQRLHQQGQFAAAEVLYEELLATQPDNIEITRCLAMLKKQHSPKKHPNPIKTTPTAVAIRQIAPQTAAVINNNDDSIEELINQGNELEDSNQLEQALASYDKAISINPNSARAHSNRGNVLQSLQRFDEALASYDRAIASKPDYAEAFYNRANTLQKLNRFNDALADHNQALHLKPNLLIAHIGLGNVLEDMKRYSEALESYQRALAIQPDYADALWCSGWCYLILGDFDKGWKNYEWRWQLPDFKNSMRNFSKPLWLGDTNLQGKTILLYSEQGLGDTIHFCRYAKQVADLGAKVILDVPSSLAHLLANLEGVSQLIVQGDTLPNFDFHCPLLSLPLAFKTRLETIPANIPYVFSQLDKVKHWQTILGEKKLLRVGLVWSGNPDQKNDQHRSLMLKEFLPLLPLNCQFISLQKELRDTDKNMLAQLPMLQFYGEQLNDFTDTAALVELMDVVICVCTSVAHLSAAMGKPTWILLSDNACWRWLLNRQDSPWYPTARLFRQNQHGDWQSVIEQVRDELLNLTAQQTKSLSTIELEAVESLINTGNDLEDTNQLEEALVSYDKAISINPNSARAHSNRGNVLQSLQRFDEALASYDRAIASKPDYAEAFYNRGNTLYALDRFDEAFSCHRYALTIKPSLVVAFIGQGNALQGMKRFDDALESYNHVLTIQPNYAQVHYNCGQALQELKRFDEALLSYNRALAIQPQYVESFINRANILRELKHFDEALASYNAALAIKADSVESLIGVGTVQYDLKDFNETIISYEKALAIDPDYELLFGNWLHIKMKICDWHNFHQNLIELTKNITREKNVNHPFAVLALLSSAPLQKRVAETYALAKYPSRLLLSPLVKHKHSRIKIGYFSADFRNHPVSYLLAELIERHDRTQFEIIAFSFHVTTEKDDMRLQLEKVFDQFIDVSHQSDEQVVHLARKLEIDIAVDLNGFTEGCRTNIFAMRAAPIQVSYLGYLGTMATDYIDYLLADETLIPVEHQHDYSEKIVYMPNSFQVNDSTLAISDKLFTRTALDLPENGFVFCCFNNSYKITPEIFSVWMQILQQVENSVLWLLESNPQAEINLRKAAVERGINANRLVFAKRAPLDEHIARHRLADLFLDTQPCNAGATACAALWGGLPILACLGESFASRMAASLLKAIGLPELITDNLTDYEVLAIQLATHPEQLAALKQKLADNRLTYPLFDTALFTRHIEAAYQAMYDHYQADLPPDHIYVSAETDTTTLLSKSIEITQKNQLQQDNVAKFQQAMSLHQQDILEQAETMYEEILQSEPLHVDTLHFLGVLKNQQGQTQRAIDLIQQAIVLSPDNIAAYKNLANIFQSQNSLDEVLTCYEQVLTLSPNDVETLSIQGNLLITLNRFNDALISCDNILVFQPNSIDVLLSRGSILQKLNRLDEALLNYEHILVISPNHAETLFRQANSLLNLKRFSEAANSYQRCLAINPNNVEVLCNLGTALENLNRFNDAMNCYKKALVIKPDCLEAHCSLFHLLKDEGQQTAAVSCLNTALATLPDSLDLHIIQLMNTLPKVVENATESSLVPIQFDTALNEFSDWLAASPEHQKDVAQSGLLPTPFFLAYRDGNHQQRLSRYGDLIAVPNKLSINKLERKKIRLAIVSHQLRRHSVWDVVTRGLLANLNRDLFEIIIYHLGSCDDEETEFAKSLANVWHDTHSVSELTAWLSILNAEQPDVIFYPEIGMDPMSARLAAHRLAPLQVTSWGHPITTGLPTIDVYFSGELLESPEADNHYREQLIRLPSTGCCTTLFPVMTDSIIPELAIGITKRHGIKFIIAQAAHKFDPADDDLYVDIASTEKDAIFILLKNNNLYPWTSDLVTTRLERAFVSRGLDPKKHLLIIPWQTSEGKFYNLLDLCDVYLDCPSFSGYTTAWKAVHRGIPIVTLEGEFMRQRLAAGLLRKIGITDTITHSRAEYVQCAVKLARECRNPIQRMARRDAIREAAPNADNDVSVVRAFEQNIIDALAKM